MIDFRKTFIRPIRLYLTRLFSICNWRGFHEYGESFEHHHDLSSWIDCNYGKFENILISQWAKQCKKCGYIKFTTYKPRKEACECCIVVNDGVKENLILHERIEHYENTMGTAREVMDRFPNALRQLSDNNTK